MGKCDKIKVFEAGFSLFRRFSAKEFLIFTRRMGFCGQPAAFL